VFRRKERLKREAFPSAIQSGRRISSPHFSAVFPRNVKGYAVVVSKKNARLSVTRHKIKRRVQEALQALSSTLPPSLILYPHPSVLDMSYDDIKKELIKLLSPS